MPNGKEKINTRFVLVHGWASNANFIWFHWLRDELDKSGCDVITPNLPNSFAPKIKDWVASLTEAVGEPNEKTYFVAHSTGCQAVLRYLEGLPENVKVGGVILVAPFLVLDRVQSKFVKEWIETPIDFKKIKAHTSKFVTIFSKDDPLVPFKNKELFDTKLTPKAVVLNNYLHFVTFFKLPFLLDEIKEILWNQNIEN